MSRNAKIALGIVGAVLLLCCVGAVATTLLGRFVLNRSIATEPEKAAQIGDEIADYDVPAGYSERLAMSLGTIEWVAIAPDTGTTGATIMLMQFLSNLSDPEQMRRQMEQSLEQQSSNRNIEMVEVGQEEVTIKGETVTLIIREGTDENGNTLRQVSGVSTGKKGPAMIMIMGDTDRWDQDAVDEFINSIR